MNGLHREWLSFLNALRFFTRIPVPERVPHSAQWLNHAARYFPAVGLLVGAISAASFGLAMAVLPHTVSVLLAMAASIYLTGAFHEDGLTDMSDGLGGGWDRARILDIMKDSRVGSYGVIAIVMVLLLKYACLSSTPAGWVPLLLMAGHAGSRYCAVLVMAALRYVRDDALSKAKPLATAVSGHALWLATLCGLLPLLWLPWLAALSGLLAALLITFWLAAKLRRWLGGYTGDCLGAVQQLSEVAFYLGALAALG